MKMPSLIFLTLTLTLSLSNSNGFIFNGFSGTNLSLDGIASITSNGLLKLTNATIQGKGHCFHSSPVDFRRSPTGGDILSFSTTFVFGIREYHEISGHGIAFLISPTKDLSTALPSHYLGLFNKSNNGNSTNQVFAVELDTIQSTEFQDIDNNHVGVDINGLISNASYPAGYYATDSNTSFHNLTLISGDAMQVWIDYNAQDTELNVTLSPIKTPKPQRPLLRSTIDLSSVLSASTYYIGFSSSTGSIITSHYILGWSFEVNGAAQALDFSKLPKLPRIRSGDASKQLKKWMPLVASIVFLLAIAAAVLLVRRRRRFAELLEDWEMEYGPHRFTFKDLFTATKGFKEKELLGVGGFGSVYRGVLRESGMEVAVKRVAHDSRQGVKEFIAEIVSIGRLRHRNLVQLLGYCRRKGELLLVYDYMPNGSLDKCLHVTDGKTGLDWAQRFRVIKGVASGLLYLHEDWEQVVVHRDIKASNVLLDGDMNGRLGDFGLARLYDHGSDPQTTHVVGTMGYIAPELARAGKATTATDVFAFGAFVLEVACGRRPIEAGAGAEQVVLVDWVFEQWRRGSIVETVDPRIGVEFEREEMELVLKLGLLCSHPLPKYRPSMRQVMQFLDGHAPLPELSPTYMNYSVIAMLQNGGLEC